MSWCQRLGGTQSTTGARSSLTDGFKPHVIEMVFLDDVLHPLWRIRPPHFCQSVSVLFKVEEFIIGGEKTIKCRFRTFFRALRVCTFQELFA